MANPNFDVDETNGPVPTTSITRAEFITAMEQLNLASGTILKAIDELASNGLIVRTGSGTVANREIAAGTGIGVTNGSGASGDPTIALGTQLVLTKYIFNDDQETVSVDTTAMLATVTTSLIDLTAGETTSLPVPTQDGIKIILNVGDAVNITITGYQAVSGLIDFSSANSLKANASIILFADTANSRWYPLGGSGL